VADQAKWAAGGLYGLTFTNVGFTLTDFNSLANGSFIIADTTQTNGTSLDTHAQVSFQFTMGGTTTAGGAIKIFLLPLHRDGSTFGDNTADGTTLPVGYLWDEVPIKVGITSGNAIYGTSLWRPLPFRDFRWGIGNTTGAAFNATSAAQVQGISGVLNLNG